MHASGVADKSSGLGLVFSRAVLNIGGALRHSPSKLGGGTHKQDSGLYFEETAPLQLVRVVALGGARGF